MLKIFFGDVWIQFFVVVFIVLTIMFFWSFFTLSDNRTPASKPKPPTKVVNNKPVQTLPTVSNPAPKNIAKKITKSSLSGTGISKIITPKVPGQYVVGPLSNPLVDTSDLNDAVFSLKDGEVIHVLEGDYYTNLEFNRNTKEIKIVGKGPETTIEIKRSGPSKSYDRKKIQFENFRLRVDGRFHFILSRSTAIFEKVIFDVRDIYHLFRLSEGTSLNLKKSIFRSLGSTQLIGSEGSSISIEDSDFEGASSIITSIFKTEISIKRSSFKNVARNVIYFYKNNNGSSIKFDESKVSDMSGHAIYSYDAGNVKIDIKESSFKNLDSAVKMKVGEISVQNSTFKNISSCGVNIRNGKGSFRYNRFESSSNGICGHDSTLEVSSNYFSDLGETVGGHNSSIHVDRNSYQNISKKRSIRYRNKYSNFNVYGSDSRAGYFFSQ